jgi:predicted nucleic acid-binding protein
MKADEKEIFLDSNILLYLLSSDASKAGKAETLLNQRPTISVQVLNEISHVSTRKLGLSWDDIELFVSTLKVCCHIVPLTTDIHDMARQTAERYQFAFYDACIIAAAIETDCRILYTEDMQSGMIIKTGTGSSLKLVNPFNSKY